MKYRKKPVVIEARQWDPHAQSSARRDILAWIDSNGGLAHYSAPGNVLVIGTLEGQINASPGDYIIRGVKGELYPCKPDIFALTYEPEATPPLAPCEPSAEMGALQARRDELVASFAGANEPTKIMLTVRLDELDRCLRAREAPSVCDHAQTNLVKDSGHGVTRPFSFYLCMACGKQLTERENAARALFVKEKLT